MSHPLVGESPAIMQIREFISQIATVNATVLIVGDPGTGKSLVARLIHDQSPRSGGPFVELAASSLFRERFVGSLLFTEAFLLHQIETTFAPASGGTVVINDVDTLTADQQAVLLRLFELRVEGENFDFDSRVIATTRVDLEQAVKHGSFREDLYYRLNVMKIEVPPLQDRREDVVPLLMHFLSPEYGAVAKVSASAAAALAVVEWPENVNDVIRLARNIHLVTGGGISFDMSILRRALQKSRTPDEFEVVFSEDLSPSEIKDALTALADYFRRCGGVGLEATFEAEEVQVSEPVGV